MTVTMTFKLSGRLTADPEIGTYQDGKPMARIRVASNTPGRDSTDFFDVATFTPDVVAALAQLGKGAGLTLTGSTRQHEWTDKAGQRRVDQQHVASTLTQVWDGRPPAAGIGAAAGAAADAKPPGVAPIWSPPAPAPAGAQR
jgi:single-strand DNA-binding protein